MTLYSLHLQSDWALLAVMGNRVYAGTLDAALIALDRSTGTPVWETQVADTLLGYSITQSPLVLKDRIIVGVAGGEFGIRGFIDAYDLETGKRLWRFNSIPGPGEFGNGGPPPPPRTGWNSPQAHSC